MTLHIVWFPPSSYLSTFDSAISFLHVNSNQEVFQDRHDLPLGACAAPSTGNANASTSDQRRLWTEIKEQNIKEHCRQNQIPRQSRTEESPIPRG